jgi:hypothetical protein
MVDAATARRSAVCLLILFSMFGFASRSQAVQRVIFTDSTFLEVEDAWADDRYVHFIYRGRPIVVLRSDVRAIEGERPAVPPATNAMCPSPRPGDDDQVVRQRFRCLGVTWVRTSKLMDGRQVWIYEARIGSRVERYLVRDGRLVQAEGP